MIEEDIRELREKMDQMLELLLATASVEAVAQQDLGVQAEWALRGVSPAGFDRWRGFYSDPFTDWSGRKYEPTSEEVTTVKERIAALQRAGSTIKGWSDE